MSEMIPSPHRPSPEPNPTLEVPEMTPEAMRDDILAQIPPLEEDLIKWRMELAELQRQHVPNAREIIPLEQKIRELGPELEARKQMQ